MVDKFAINTQSFSKQTLWLFLALYILLLGIFIVMFSISVILEEKAREVVESVRNSLQPMAISGYRDQEASNLIEGPRLIIRINEILIKDRAVANIKFAQSGLTLYADFNVAAMFPSGSAAMYRQQSVILRQVAAVFKAPAPSWRYEINITMPLDYVDDQQFPMVETLAMQRAAEIMRTLVDGGVPFSMITVSVRKSESPEMAVVFKAIKLSEQEDTVGGVAANE